MTVLLAALLLGGMPSGLAAFLQAEAKGWKYIAGFSVLLLLGFGSIWALAYENDADALVGDPRALSAVVIVSFMFWSLIGAIVGKIWGQSVNPVKLGVRTAVLVSGLKYALSMLVAFS